MSGVGVRPTKRCLDQLSMAPPTIDVVLSDLLDEPIPIAQEFPQRHEAGGLRRVLALKDRVWFKLKSGRWRGAVVRLTTAELEAEAAQSAGRDEDPCFTTEYRWWLGAVGLREAGSRTDFYADTARSASCAVTPQKKDGIDTDLLLPREWDRKRLRAEVAYAERQIYKKVMIEATARSLRSGKVIKAEFAEFSMGVVVRADRGEQFVAFIARSVFDPARLAVMMDALPGVAGTDWAPEPGGIADLQPKSGEIIWSAWLTTDAADQILDMAPESDE